MRLLWWMSLPTFVFFGLFAFTNGGGEPNWPIVAYLSGLVLAAGVRSQESGVRGQVLLKVGVIGIATLGMVVTLALHAPMQVQPVLLRLAGPATPAQPTPIRRVDPTARLRGWRFLAAEVDRARTDLRRRGIEPVLASERWTQAGELAFYCEGRPRVHCLGVLLGDRHCQYDLWRPNPLADPARFAGQTFVLVNIDLERLPVAFERIEARRIVEYREQGARVAAWTITIAHNFRGFGRVEAMASY